MWTRIKSRYLNYLVFLVLVHLPWSKSTEYISCSAEFTNNSGSISLKVRGEILTPFPPDQEQHDGMFIHLGDVLNNSFEGLPCDSMTFSPSEGFSGGCKYIWDENEQSIYISPGAYRKKFTSWEWTFTNIIAFSSQPTHITCRVHPYLDSNNYYATITDIIIPGSMQSLTVDFEEEAREGVAEYRTLYLNLSLRNSYPIEAEGYIEIEFPGISILKEDICENIRFQSVFGDAEKESCDMNIVRIVGSEISLSSYYLLELGNLRNPPTMATDYYKVRVSIFAYENIPPIYYRRETAAFFWTGTYPVELRDNNVAHSIFCPDVLSFELTIHLHSLFPPLHTEDIITVILPSIYSPATAYSLPGSLHYSEKSIDGNTIKVQVLTDNQFDIQLAILSILQPHPGITSGYVEISTSRYILERNEDAVIHNTKKLLNLQLRSFGVNVAIDPSGSREVEEYSTYIFSIQPDRNLSRDTSFTITFSPYLSINSNSSCTRLVGESSRRLLYAPGGETSGGGEEEESPGPVIPPPTTPGEEEEEIITLDIDPPSEVTFSPYSVDYICCYESKFKITSIKNPLLTYYFWEIFFRLEVSGENGYRKEGIVLDGGASDIYIGKFHSEVVSGSSFTGKKVKYHFRYYLSHPLIHRDPIIRIELPQGMRFIGPPPEYTQYALLDPPDTNPFIRTVETLHGFVIAINIQISLLPSSYTHFSIDLTHILNPYKLAIYHFKLAMYDNVQEALLGHYIFEENEKFVHEIDRISNLELQLSIDNLMTNMNGSYKFSITLDQGDLPPKTYVRVNFPNDIQSCDASSMNLVQGCLTELPGEQKYKFSEYIYGYRMPDCTTLMERIIIFEIRCINPETMRESGDISVKLQWEKYLSSSVFYECNVSMITMVNVSQFLSVELNLENSWIDQTNTFTFSITRSIPYTTTDVNALLIALSPGLDIICGSDILSNISGIVVVDNTLLTPTCNQFGTEIQILLTSIKCLEGTFGFSISNITNPSYNESISVNIKSMYVPGELGSEYGITNSIRIECDRPCRTCENYKDNCTSCYSEGSSAFGDSVCMHLLYVEDDIMLGTCVDICPPHYFITLTNCAPCDRSCLNCSFMSTNCTQCYPKTYLLSNQCVDDCINNYVPNNSTWKCDPVLGFLEGTSISIMNENEIGKLANYTFFLKPEGGLNRDSILLISKSDLLGVSATCAVSPLGTCAISDSIITISDFLTQDYIPGGNGGIELNIINTFINPEFNYPYSSILFLLTTQNISIIHHSQTIALSIEGDSRYQAHHLLGSVSLHNTSTVANTTVRFILENPVYIIPSGYEIQIHFPEELRFISENPQFTINENLDNAAYISHIDYPEIMIYDAFRNLPLPSDSNFSFSISNIVTGYKIGETESLSLRIGPRDSTLSLFMGESGLKARIDSIGELELFTATPTKFMTSEMNTYIFTIKLGMGYLRADDYILFNTPESVTDCDESSIVWLTNINSPITSKGYSNSMYYIVLTQSLPYGTTISFSILCRNPETTRRTGNFVVEIWENNPLGSNIWNQFYKVSENTDSSICMTSQNNFRIITTIFGNNYPLNMNSFIIEVKRTAEYQSRDLNEIQIIAPQDINLTQCTVEFIEGFYGNPTLVIVNQTIYIQNFTALNKYFLFKLNGLRNPPLHTNMSFSLSTQNSDGHLSEFGYTQNISINCDFPCKNCSNTISSHCFSCFNKNEEVFEYTGEEFYMLTDQNSTCVSSCPPGNYYIYGFPHQLCFTCNTNCSECEGYPNNCISCKENTFLFNNKCLTECPSTHFENKSNWTCNLLLLYEEGTQIFVEFNYEIESLATYTFTLKPEKDLVKDAQIQITSPSLIGVHPICTTSLGICSISASLITLEDILTEDYNDSNSTPIIFSIRNTYINPPLSYPFSYIKFLVQTKYLGKLLHSASIAVSGTGNYLPHSFGNLKVVLSSPTTVTKSVILFRMMNKDHSLHSGSEIRVIFPENMTFGVAEAKFNTLRNLLPYPSVEFNSYPEIIISEGLKILLPRNSSIEFELKDVLTPYVQGRSDSFRVYSGEEIEGELYKQFVGDSGLEVEIINVASFASFTVVPSNYTTSEVCDYEFEIYLGEGGLRAGHHLQFQIPQSVKVCNPNKIVGKEGLIIARGYHLSNSSYYFSLLGDVAAKSNLTFSIECENPETGKLTEEFSIGAYWREGIFYRSSGSEIAMKLYNNFEEVEVAGTDFRPSMNNTFTFTLIRTSNYTSTDLDCISIRVPAEMDPTYFTFHLISGITEGTAQLSLRRGKRIVIRGIIQMEKRIEFELIDITNPSMRIIDIAFILTTYTSGFAGEQATTNILHTTCDFPCASCRESAVNCSSCFPKECGAFESWGEEAYILLPGNNNADLPIPSTCVSSCPPHHYPGLFPPPSQSTYCLQCHLSCSECLQTYNNCTKCYPSTFLFTGHCVSPSCPEGYSEDIINWECHLIRGFHSQSIVSILQAESEIGTMATYTFTLLPDGFLPPLADIYILSPSPFPPITSCSSNFTYSTCILQSYNHIMLTQILSEDYIDGVSDPIVFDLLNTYTNPTLVYFYSELSFQVQIKVGDTKYFQGIIPLSTLTHDAYAAHPLGNTTVEFGTNKTVTAATISISMFNTNFEIPEDYQIKILFPASLTFNTLNPTFIPIAGLGIDPIIIYNYPSIYISQIFDLPMLAANTHISFVFNDILSPYQRGLTHSFAINICSPYNRILFSQTDALELNITEIAELAGFSIVLSCYKSITASRYEFIVKLGEGEISERDKIRMERPEEVTECEHESIRGEEGFILPITASYAASTGAQFYMPHGVQADSIIIFSMVCLNPESTRPTHKGFTIHISKYEGDFFYRQEGNPISLQSPNNFTQLPFLSMKDNRPMINNTFTFTIIRTANYTSKDIDKITIKPLSIQVKVFSLCSLTFIDGLIAGSPRILSTQENTIIITGILQLAKTFSFSLTGIQNPGSSRDEIQFRVRTQNEGYICEEANTNILYTKCNFPCQTCLTGRKGRRRKRTIPDHCETCFTKNDPVFGNIYVEQMAIYFHVSECLSSCPPSYFPDTTDWRCHSCYPNCASCTSQYATGCATCYPDENLFLDGHCGTCSLNYFFNAQLRLCEYKSCSPECLRCTGPGNNACISCDTPNEYYPVKGKGNKCRFMCQDEDRPLYLEKGECKQCDRHCSSCVSGSDRECRECKDPYYLGKYSECIYTDCANYPNTFPSQGICLLCDENCLGCSNYSYNCLACAPQYFLFKDTNINYCIPHCPTAYYSNTQLYICQPCPEYCEVCEATEIASADILLSITDLKCIQCEFSYYMNNSEQCINGSMCGVLRFPNQATKTCDLCSVSCLGCNGPTNKDCRQCNSHFLLTENGACDKIQCQSDEYLEIDTYICKKCNGRCIGCTGATDYDCKICNNEYLMNPKLHRCQTCSEFSPVYWDPLPGDIACREVCGDGKNMRIEECDDGNTISGDGCSSDCLVEEHFMCEGGNYTHPDICHETIPPFLTAFNQLNHQQFLIHFSEFVQFKVLNTTLAFYLRIKGPATKYDFEIENRTLAVENSIFLDLTININFLCSLFGDEELILSINGTKKILDLAGNKMLDRSIPLKLQPFEYITEGEKKRSEGAGTSSEIIIATTLLTALLINVIFNTPLEGLWGIINVLQLISYTIFLPLFFPKNLLIFLDIIMLAHGYNKFIPNIFKYLIFDDGYHENSYNKTFKNRGLDSRTTILLIGSELTLILIILAIISICVVLRKFKKFQNVLDKVLKKLRYSVLIRSIITGYLKIVLAAFLNFAIISYWNYESIYTSIFCIFLVSCVVFLPAYLSEFMFRNHKRAQNSQEFLDKFDSLFKEFAIAKGVIQMNFYPVFFFRRSIFGAILIFLYDFPVAQLILIQVTTFLMILWLLFTLPFKDKLISFAHIFSEIGFLIYVSTLYTFLSESIETQDRLYYGSIILWGLIVLIIINWIVFLVYLVKFFITKRRLRIFKEQEELLAKAKEQEKNILREKKERRRKGEKDLQMRELKRIKDEDTRRRENIAYQNMLERIKQKEADGEYDYYKEHSYI